MHLGELEGLTETERNDRFSPLHPLVRRLTGAEKVHLASGGALRPKLISGASDAREKHREPDARQLAGLDAFC